MLSVASISILGPLLLLSTGQTPEAAPDWPAQVARGDAARGRTLFESDRLGCVRCHATERDSRPRGGPNLQAIRTRQTPSGVAESIREPSRIVNEPYRSERVRTRDGLEVIGLVVSEANAKLTVLLPDGTRKAFHRGEVLDRAPRPGSIMPSGRVTTPEDWRDLLAFLGSLGPRR